jgi:Tol biopolymer transport system component
VWRFQTGQIQALFSMVVDQEKGYEQLFRLPLSFDEQGRPIAAEPIPLTAAPFGIWDFTVSPADGQVVYSALNEDGTSNLWALASGAQEATELIDCPEAACTGPVFSPDGARLAFSRRNAAGFAAPMVSPPRLWLLDLATGESSPLFADDQQLAFDARWSVDGRWLSYLSPQLGGVGVIQLEDGRTAFYPTATGEPGIWHPQREELLMTEMLEGESIFQVHLFAIDSNQEGKRDLSSGEFAVEDNAPAWSPDGLWLAFRRKELAGPRESLGKQLWRMRGDGSEAQPLTTDPEYDHGPPSWSSDGRYLLYHRFPLRGPDITISVWLLDIQTGEQFEIARPGQRPIWLP